MGDSLKWRCYATYRSQGDLRVQGSKDRGLLIHAALKFDIADVRPELAAEIGDEGGFVEGGGLLRLASYEESRFDFLRYTVDDETWTFNQKIRAENVFFPSLLGEVNLALGSVPSTSSVWPNEQAAAAAADSEAGGTTKREMDDEPETVTFEPVVEPELSVKTLHYEEEPAQDPVGLVDALHVVDGVKYPREPWGFFASAMVNQFGE